LKTAITEKDVVISINKLTKGTYKKLLDKKHDLESIYILSQLRHDTVFNMVSTVKEADNFTPVKAKNGQSKLVDRALLDV